MAVQSNDTDLKDVLAQVSKVKRQELLLALGKAVI